MKLGFGKRNQKDPADETSSEVILPNRLKELCGGDGDLYEAMSKLMFLDPKKITTDLESAVSNAQGFESQGNKMRAEVGYRIAGGISLSRGDANGVRTYFEKAATIAGNSRPEYQILAKRNNEAVSIARKFYDEFSK